MRLGLFLLFSIAVTFAQTAIKPTTTLLAETGNNTSAPDTISTLTQGHAITGNVSKVPMRTLLYPGANTKVYAALMGWFGKASHLKVGYNSQDPTQVNKQIVDMKSRGIDGAILAWYGKDSYENKTALALKTAAEANGVEFSLMIDRGTLDYDSMGLAPTDAIVVHLNYMADTYFNSSMYSKIDGRPVVYEFALEAYAIDWVRVRNSIRGNPLIIFRNPNGWTRPTSDGAYAWEPDKPNTSYLDYFYQQSTLYPTLQTVGGVSPMMNDSLASWTENRLVDPQCGQTWLTKWANQKKWFSATKPLRQIQIATWNDYEEGTTIESGIDNCVTVNAVVSGSSVTWSISGAGLENTIDHYTVYISQDGQNLMKLAEVPTSIHSLELDPFKFPAGLYSIFVEAVGKPALTNKVSSPTYYSSTFVPNRPPVARLTLSADTPYSPSTVIANAASSSDPDGNLSSVAIHWGDGSTFSGKLASHVYNAPGTYTITATATDSAGLTNSTSSSVTVLSRPSGSTPLITTATIRAGESASYAFTANAGSTAVRLSVSAINPSAPTITCSVTPSEVLPSNTQPIAVNCKTQAPQLAGLDHTGLSNGPALLATLGFGGLPLSLVLLPALSLRKSRGRSKALFLALLAGVLLTACGGGATTTTTTTTQTSSQQQVGTQKGTYTISVVATDSAGQSTNALGGHSNLPLTLVVQ